MCQGIVNNAGMDNPDINGICKSDCGTGEYRALSVGDHVVILDDKDDGSHSIDTFCNLVHFLERKS